VIKRKVSWQPDSALTRVLDEFLCYHSTVTLSVLLLAM